MIRRSPGHANCVNCSVGFHISTYKNVVNTATFGFTRPFSVRVLSGCVLWRKRRAGDGSQAMLCHKCSVCFILRSFYPRRPFTVLESSIEVPCHYRCAVCFVSSIDIVEVFAGRHLVWAIHAHHCNWG